MKNIIIFGEIGSGKDTAAELLAKHLNANVVKLGKEIREDVDRLHEILPYKANKRTLYQEYGQGMRKIFGKDIWNNVLHESIKDGLQEGQLFVIADGRQHNEFTYWTNMNFVPIAVVADQDIRMSRINERDGFDQSAMLDHETEISAREIIQIIRESESTRKAFTLVNNGTLDELELQVNQIVNQLIQRPLVGSL